MRHRDSIKKEMTEGKLGYLMSAPALLLILGLGIYPAVYTAILSFEKVNLMANKQEFVGLMNYTKLVSDDKFWNSMWITLYFTAVSLAFQLILGTAIAFLLNREFKGRTAVRAVMLIPWTLPTIVNATLWGWIYNANYGALNRLLMGVGLIDRFVIWMGDAKLALHAIILADSWRMMPLCTLMILAGLQTIPMSSLESATIDGANGPQKLRYIHFPLIKPMIMVVLVLRTLQTLRVFDIIYQLTQGGPANGTTTISFYTYFQTFKYMNFGYGSAVAVTIALITMGFSACYVLALRSDDVQ